MLNRVTKALIKHLHPIAKDSESPTPSIPKDTKDQEFQRFQEKKQPKEEKNGPSHLKQVGTSVEPDPGPLNPFVTLFSQLKKEQNAILKWLGRKLYLTSMKDQKQMGKQQQGVMIDKKAE